MPLDRSAVLVLALAAAAGGCASLRWRGHPSQAAAAQPEAGGLSISTSAARAKAEFPAVKEGPVPETLYYADLGPDSIDVSKYPAQQRYNYEVFKRVCAECHTLARAINSPVESRMYWRFHLLRMDLHARAQERVRRTPQETKAVLDFLAYDAKVRKIEQRERFQRQTAELKRRFQPVLERAIQRLQESRQPVITQ